MSDIETFLFLFLVLFLISSLSRQNGRMIKMIQQTQRSSWIKTTMIQWIQRSSWSCGDDNDRLMKWKAWNDRRKGMVKTSYPSLLLFPIPKSEILPVLQLCLDHCHPYPIWFRYHPAIRRNKDKIHKLIIGNYVNLDLKINWPSGRDSDHIVIKY